MHGLVAGNEGDAILVLPAHLARIPAAALFAVDAHDHFQRVGIGDFVGGDDAGTERIGIVEIFAFARPEIAQHFQICSSRAERSLKIV